MNTTGTGAMLCAHCGRPAMTLVQIGGMGYHLECTRGPGFEQTTLRPVSVQHYTEKMTDERVRQIVRDELQRAGLLNSPNA